MRTARRLGRDSTRNGVYFAPKFGGGARCDQRSAALRGFHDHYPEGHTCYGAIALRKVSGLRRGAGKKLRDESSVGRDLVGERAVLRWIPEIDAMPEHRDGPPSTGERAAMRGGVDAAREAAHDGDAARGEIGGE